MNGNDALRIKMQLKWHEEYETDLMDRSKRSHPQVLRCIVHHLNIFFPLYCKQIYQFRSWSLKYKNINFRDTLHYIENAP